MIPEYDNPTLDRIGLKNKKQVTQEKQGTGSDPFQRIPPGKWLNPEKIKVCSMILGFYSHRQDQVPAKKVWRGYSTPCLRGTAIPRATEEKSPRQMA